MPKILLCERLKFDWSTPPFLFKKYINLFDYLHILLVQDIIVMIYIFVCCFMQLQHVNISNLISFPHVPDFSHATGVDFIV